MLTETSCDVEQFFCRIIAFVEKQIIAKYQGMIAIKEKAQEEYNRVLNEIKDAVELMTDAKGANHFLEHIGDYKGMGNSVILYARDIFAKKVKSLGLTYNKETKQYEDAA